MSEQIVVEPTENQTDEPRTYTAEEMQVLADALEAKEKEVSAVRSRLSEVNEESKQRRLTIEKLQEQVAQQEPQPAQPTRTTARVVDDRVGKLEAELRLRDYRDAIGRAAEKAGVDAATAKELAIARGVPEFELSDSYGLAARAESHIEELAERFPAIRLPEVTVPVAQTKPMYVPGAEGELPGPSDMPAYLDYLAANDPEKFAEVYDEVGGDNYIFEDTQSVPPSLL